MTGQLASLINPQSDASQELHDRKTKIEKKVTDKKVRP